MKRRTMFGAVFAVLWYACALGAQTLEPIRYTVSFPAPATHYLEIDAVYPTEGQDHIDLMMAVWTPGSYLVREYSRNVESLTASAGAGSLLTVEKTRKNRWRVQTQGAPAIHIHYRLYAHEMSVRTDWVDDEFALLNGAATFITLAGVLNRPHEVRVILPPTWTRSVSGMPAGTASNSYRAPDYDTLVDSPIVAGNPTVHEFVAGGKRHALVTVGEGGTSDSKKAAQDLAPIAQKTIDFWKGAPYDAYYFFNVVRGDNGATGGLEHKNSTVLSTGPDGLSNRASYLRWLSGASHEFFHAWNVKRLRPIELGPFDYENEVYTRSLWFAEGVTDYYADLQMRRAGLSTTLEYLAQLSAEIGRLQTTPGRLVQPVEQASYDAWIKAYRPDENINNTAISYYTKGLAIGFVLDAKIRRLTGGTKSLDDAMRLLYQRFSGPKGFTPLDLRNTIVDVAGAGHGQELRGWFVKTLETTDELDYREALDWYGLQFKPMPNPPRPALGVATIVDGDRTIVAEVVRDSAAALAGIAIDDQIVAINDTPLPQGQLAAVLAGIGAGHPARITISRRGVPRVLNVTLGSDQRQAWQLEVSPSATAAQVQHRSRWLEE